MSIVIIVLFGSFTLPISAVQPKDVESTAKQPLPGVVMPPMLWPVPLDQYAMSQNRVYFPAVEGYEILAGDFHNHTIFSDGQVTPEVRVWEAWRDGLDILSLTDHPEYLDQAFPAESERAFGRVKPLADELGLILIRGAELTTAHPPRLPFSDFVVHFLTDESAMKGDFFAAIRAAREQGATIVWAHPGAGWTKEARWLLEQGWLDGIELRNGGTGGSAGTSYHSGLSVSFYPQVMEWCTKNNLAPFANSDAHWPIDHYYRMAAGERRDMTLVLARTHDQAGVKEAIQQRRVISYFNETLWGPERWVKGIAEAAIEFGAIGLIRPREQVFGVFVTNRSSFPFQVFFSADAADAWFRPILVNLAPRAQTMVPFVLRGKSKSFPVTLKLTNVFTAVDHPLTFVHLIGSQSATAP